MMKPVEAIRRALRISKVSQGPRHIGVRTHYILSQISEIIKLKKTAVSTEIMSRSRAWTDACLYSEKTIHLLDLDMRIKRLSHPRIEAWLTIFGHHPGYCGILVRLEMLWLRLLATGHAADTLRDVSAFCRYISSERMKKKCSQIVWLQKITGISWCCCCVDCACRYIIMIVNNALRLMVLCERDWLKSSGHTLDMVMRDRLSN